MLQTLGGDIPEPVKALDPGTVAQVKMGYRIERSAGGGPFLKKIARAQPHQRLVKNLGDMLVLVPVFLFQQRQQVVLRLPFAECRDCNSLCRQEEIGGF